MLSEIEAASQRTPKNKEHELRIPPKNEELQRPLEQKIIESNALGPQWGGLAYSIDDAARRVGGLFAAEVKLDCHV